MPENISTDDLIRLTRKYMKERLLINFTSFRGHQEQWQQLKDIVQRTAETGESNSALLIGPRGSGKTTLISSVLSHLQSEDSFTLNTLFVHLSGLIHTNDALALKAITSQLKLENDVEGRIFGSFSDNLAYLLSCLKAGHKGSKSVVFILEEFDLFCGHHNQTLLYNLFDVAQSAQAPICVIGITCRLDVVELLEKRVKSRFSHRQIFLFHGDNKNSAVLERMNLFTELLSLPMKTTQKTKLKAQSKICNKTYLTSFDEDMWNFPSSYVKEWNTNIKNLSKDKEVQTVLQNIFQIDLSGRTLQNLLVKLVANISTRHPVIMKSDITGIYNTAYADHKVTLLTGLSVLELCLIIAMKHHTEIYDGEPFNFEMVLNRYSKFSNTNTSIQNIQREVVLKAFEHLKILELVAPLNAGKVQKEYQLHRLVVMPQQVNIAVGKYSELPTEVEQWAKSSII